MMQRWIFGVSYQVWEKSVMAFAGLNLDETDIGFEISFLGPLWNIDQLDLQPFAQGGRGPHQCVQRYGNILRIENPPTSLFG